MSHHCLHYVSNFLKFLIIFTRKCFTNQNYGYISNNFEEPTVELDTFSERAKLKKPIRNRNKHEQQV